MRVDRDSFAAAVSRAIQGLPQSPVIPIRAGILLRSDNEGVHFTCGDEDTIFTVTMEAARTNDITPCVLPGKMLSEMMRYLPEGKELNLEVEGDHATFVCGRSSFILGAKPGKDYPQWQDPPAPLCTLEGAELASGLRRIAAAASDEDPTLYGVLLELEDGKLTLSATDKYKLGMTNILATTSLGTNSTALLLARTADKFARACEKMDEARLGWNDGSLVSLQTEGLTIVTRQVAGSERASKIIEQAARFFEEEREQYTCVTADLTRAVKMASLMATDDRVELTFNPGSVEVTAGRAEQVVECSYKGQEDVTLALGGRNLLAGLGGCGEEVALSFTAPRKPLFLYSEGLRWLVQTRGQENYG